MKESRGRRCRLVDRLKGKGVYGRYHSVLKMYKRIQLYKNEKSISFFDCCDGFNDKYECSADCCGKR